jgi:hypothetical protein
MKNLRHIVRIRTEDDAASVAPDRADAVFVNANMLEWRPARLAGRLSCTKLPTLVDPVLWRFQVPAWWRRREDNQAKLNYARLAAAYQQGSGIDLSDGIRLPDSGKNAAWSKLAANAVSYQRTRATEAAGQLLQLLDLGVDPAPTAIVAPYLLARNASEDEINRSLLRATSDEAGEPVVAHVAIPLARAYDGREVAAAAATLSGIPLAGVVLWIELCTESLLMDRPELMKHISDLVGQLGASGVPVWHGHGGYTTVALLRDAGLSGIVHSCTWSDHGNPATQAPPGVQPACITYVPGLAEPRRFEFARSVGARLDRSSYERLYCSCALCMALFARGDHPLEILTEEKVVKGPRDRDVVTLSDGAETANLFHFLLARHQEVAALYSPAAMPDIVARAMRRGDELMGHAQHLHRLLDMVA